MKILKILDDAELILVDLEVNLGKISCLVIMAPCRYRAL